MIYFALVLSVILNILGGWYIVKLLRKFIFVSENLSDLYLTIRAFKLFVKSLYGMDSYRGEPMIQELIIRTQEVNQELGGFRDIFQHTLDEELEEEFDAAEEEAQAP